MRRSRRASSAGEPVHRLVDLSAAVDPGDERHADARRVLGQGDTLLTSDHVLGTDRTSFAVMLRLGIHRAASLDKDFAVFRFGPRRDRAFEIAR